VGNILENKELWLELIVDSVRVGLRQQRPVVVLKEKVGERYLAIWIGSDMAQAITLALQEQETPRPMTHDLFMAAVTLMKSEISEARIVDLKEDVYFANVLIQPLDAGEEVASLDARASDALALAIRAKAPIKASEGIMDRAGITLPAHVDLDDDGETELINPVTDEELAKLSAFRDLVEGLNLDDLGDLSES